MPNAIDYIDWRGDIPLSVSPFNEVDNLLVCKLVSLDFTDIVPSEGERSIQEAVRYLHDSGFAVIAASEKSAKLYTEADYSVPVALVMGAEDTGISKEVLKLCDEQLAIPMIGHIESLNVSAAAAVMLFEVVRQRIGE